MRRTLAFSIHEMAIILGSEITHRDLVPVFDGFLKDLDEVRIGVLRHFADFLRVSLHSTSARLKLNGKMSKIPIFQDLLNYYMGIKVSCFVLFCSHRYAG